MKNYYPYLKDKSFLDQLFHTKVISYFAKVIALNWNEEPIENIQGKIISGSFNIDGNSSIRRTGNLSLITQSFNSLIDMNSLFSINKKVSIEIGLSNTTVKYSDYPIVWFPMGIYVINSASSVHGVNNLTVNLQLKDKMCLLNGECGGIIPAATVFDNLYSIDENGNQVKVRPTIYQIIQELVHHLGGEALSKIIISDLQTRVKQVMKWTGSSPLYMVQKSNQYRMTINPTDYASWSSQGWSDVDGSPFQYGRDVGYIYTDFTYPGELICDAGARITDQLDQIISVLGNYEYFYDIYGNFIFQQKKNYLNNSLSKTIIDKINSGGNLDTEDYLLDMSNGKTVYRFENSDLIISYNNSPQYNMIKNDYVIWGTKTNSSGLKMPIRYHLAIDKKPDIGNTYEAFSYVDPLDNIKKWHYPIKYSSRNNFPTIGAEGTFYYDQSTQKIYTWSNSEYIQIEATLQSITTKDWRTELYFQGVMAETLGTDRNPYYAELKNEWPKIYNILPNQGNTNNSSFKEQILQDFTRIDYFLDFIDSNSNISEFSINNIGKRSYVANDENINCVFEPNIPDIILIKESGSTAVDPITGKPTTEMSLLRYECQRRGQDYYQVPDVIYDMLVTGGGFNSGYQCVRQLLHQYTSYNENVSISCLPLYFLEPNTRIFIQDTPSGIYGDYMINSLSINLDASSAMTINATRALQRK